MYITVKGLFPNHLRAFTSQTNSWFLLLAATGCPQVTDQVLISISQTHEIDNKKKKKKSRQELLGRPSLKCEPRKITGKWGSQFEIDLITHRATICL